MCLAVADIRREDTGMELIDLTADEVMTIKDARDKMCSGRWHRCNWRKQGKIGWLVA